MSLFATIKSIFVKDLAKITAPLDRIYTDLDNFITRVKADIIADEQKAKALFTKNEVRKIDIEAATLVKSNIDKLLGTTPQTTTTPTV